MAKYGRNSMNPSVPGDQPYFPQADSQLTNQTFQKPRSAEMSIDINTPPTMRGKAPEKITAATLKNQQRRDDPLRQRFGKKAIPRDI